jgi:hypothetical protein
LAATGKRGMDVVAGFAETWVSVDSRGPLQPQLRLLEESCTRIGRDPASVHRLRLLGHQVNPLASTGAFADAAGELAEQGISDMVVHWPRRKPPFAADLKILERIAAKHLMTGRQARS